MGFEKLVMPEALVKNTKNGTYDVILLLRQTSKTTVKWADKSSASAWIAANKAVATDVLETVPQASVQHQYDAFAGLSLTIDQDTLLQLMTDPRVLTIEPVLSVELHDTQADALISATIPKQTWNGAGVTIAILDSGVDYTHPQLGNGGFPNAKVISGIDVAENDFNPIPAAEAGTPNSRPSSHGTHCAGIAAGDVSLQQDYNGGMAPAAKIAAVKVFPDGLGGTGTDEVAAGINWCITNQYANPDFPILVMNMSLGGGKFTGTSCSGQTPAYDAAIFQALAAGITVVSSSGNNGFCDAVGAPACVDGVIAVGAVFDANLGIRTSSVDSSSCHSLRSVNTVTDNANSGAVTPYSNSSPRVDLVAPSNDAATLDLVGTAGATTGNYYQAFNGTSASAPYVSGTIALLQQAAKESLDRYLTPEEVKQLLINTGETAIDTKGTSLSPGYTFPLLNVEKSLDGLLSPLDDALELSNTSITVGGSAPWVIDEIAFVEGGSSLRSGVIQDNEESWFELTAPDAITLKFFSRIASEPEGDLLQVSINEVVEFTQSGSLDWTEQTLSILPGSTIRFTYIKNSTGSQGVDAAWIDNIRLIADVPVLPFNPSPADDSTGVPYDGFATITWNNGQAVSGITHDFFFGTNPATLTRFGNDLTTPSYTPLLSDGVTYHWKVISSNSFGSTEGPVWSFRTAEDLPPTSPVLKPVLAAEIAAPGIDPEGTAVSYRLSWESSSVEDVPVVINTPTTQTLYTLQEAPGRTFTVGETWTLTVTSRDATGVNGGSAMAVFVIGEQEVRFEGWTFE